MITDVKIAVIGNVDSGKSTLIGTLLKGINDDSRGLNRNIVMNYTHEKETGQTSSIGYQILGFREDGTSISVDHKTRKDNWPKIMKETTKLITFIDLAGHEKYLKTTINGLSANHPDYALILVEGRGIRGMTKEHLMLVLSYSIPFIIVITKIDLYGPEIVNSTIKSISNLLSNAKKDCWVIDSPNDFQFINQNKTSFVPIFKLSNVTGSGITLFKDYLFKIPTRINYGDLYSNPFEISVIESFMVQGIGCVAHGFVTSGTVKVGDHVFIGPDSTGNYHKSKIRSLQYKRINVDFVLAGHHCTISLPNIERNLLKQGVYILHEKVQPRLSIKSFIANIKILNTHATTIKIGYCPILNLDNIRMAARIKQIMTDTKQNSVTDTTYLRGGSTADIEFEFMYRPAYLKPNTIFVFREGKTRGYGKVINIKDN
jgi:small GTP-binding protein